MSDIKDRLLAACNGHPTAAIPWPHRLLHDAIDQIEAQQARIEALTKAVDSFTALINESGGVYGLHLNGDPAPWAELMIGGRFEEWLLPLALLNKQEPSND